MSRALVNKTGRTAMQKGGSAKKQMIKRADGSYSQRGLWDNIRANKGSGRKPSAEMLKQERKIKAKKYQTGGQPMSKELKTIVDLIRSGNEPMMEKKLPGMIKKLTPAQRDSLYSGKANTSKPFYKKYKK